MGLIGLVVLIAVIGLGAVCTVSLLVAAGRNPAADRRPYRRGKARTRRAGGLADSTSSWWAGGDGGGSHGGGHHGCGGHGGGGHGCGSSCGSGCGSS